MNKIVVLASLLFIASCSSEESDASLIVTLTGEWHYYSTGTLRNTNDYSTSSLTITSNEFIVNQNSGFLQAGSFGYTIHNYTILKNTDSEFYATFQLYIGAETYDCKLSRRSDYPNNGYLTIEHDEEAISYFK